MSLATPDSAGSSSWGEHSAYPGSWSTAVLFCTGGPAPALHAQQPPAASFAERTAGMQRTDGFVPFYWDTNRGRVLIEIPAFGEDVLYYVSAASGAGSVELPFDRGILSSGVIRFERAGPRVLVVQQNLAGAVY